MKRKGLVMLCLAIAMTATAQNKYCKSYEDFKADQWTEIDTVYLNGHSKSHQLWVGGNDYKLTTGDKAQDEIIKKEAFAVICKDTIYVNCRNLRFENTGFGNGYTKGYRYDGDKLCIVNKIIGKAALTRQSLLGGLGGAVGGAIAASSQMSNQVCYLIESDAKKGKVNIRLIDDAFMAEVLKDHQKVADEYNAIKKKKDRQSAATVFPILQHLGLVD